MITFSEMAKNAKVNRHALSLILKVLYIHTYVLLKNVRLRKLKICCNWWRISGNQVTCFLRWRDSSRASTCRLVRTGSWLLGWRSPGSTGSSTGSTGSDPSSSPWTIRRRSDIELKKMGWEKIRDGSGLNTVCSDRALVGLRILGAWVFVGAYVIKSGSGLREN
jgi:hypothetical protein